MLTRSEKVNNYSHLPIITLTADTITTRLEGLIRDRILLLLTPPTRVSYIKKLWLKIKIWPWWPVKMFSPFMYKCFILQAQIYKASCTHTVLSPILVPWLVIKAVALLQTLKKVCTLFQENVSIGHTRSRFIFQPIQISIFSRQHCVTFILSVIW